MDDTSNEISGAFDFLKRFSASSSLSDVSSLLIMQPSCSDTDSVICETLDNNRTILDDVSTDHYRRNSSSSNRGSRTYSGETMKDSVLLNQMINNEFSFLKDHEDSLDSQSQLVSVEEGSVEKSLKAVFETDDKLFSSSQKNNSDGTDKTTITATTYERCENDVTQSLLDKVVDNFSDQLKLNNQSEKHRPVSNYSVTISVNDDEDRIENRPTDNSDVVVRFHEENQVPPVASLSEEDESSAVKLRHRTTIIVNSNDLEQEDEDKGIYVESFRSAQGVFVGEDSDEASDDSACKLPNVGMEQQPGVLFTSLSGKDTLDTEECSRKHERSDSISTTISEVEYRRTYREISLKRIERNASVDKYKRENTALVTAEKKAVLHRPNNGNCGFHIKGSHPTIISTVVEGSPADIAGIEVGDVIIAINYESVLHMDHAAIVEQLKNAGASFTMELCMRQSLITAQTTMGDSEVCSGYMSMLSNAILNIWKKRWFVLKSDNCLYYYKSRQSTEILGAIPLFGYILEKDMKKQKPHSMKLMHRTKSYILATENEIECTIWADCLNKATKSVSTVESTWIDASAHNVGLPALSIQNADCHGYIYKMGGHYKNWKKRYAVLKEGCLYYYCSIDSTSAQGVAHLHGYTVDEHPVSHKKNAFNLIPPEKSMRTYCFYADTEIEKERWVLSMKSSIGRWVKVG